MAVIKPNRVTVNSSNPNDTAGRAAAPVSSLSYPVGELLSKWTVMRFVQYRRWTASDVIQNNTTAILNLPMPIQIPENNQMKIDSFDAGYLANHVDTINNMAKGAISGKSISDMMYEMKQAYSGISKKDAVRAAALSPYIFNDDAQKQFSATGGLVKNPHTTSIFDGVQLRTFGLTWRFSPRSLQESETLKNVINTIRERMYPAESFEGFALDYPDLVFIEFAGDSTEYLPKFYRSFITNMSTNPSSGEGIAFYKSGAPVNIELNMTFTETNIITRNVLQGDSTMTGLN